MNISASVRKLVAEAQTEMALKQLLKFIEGKDEQLFTQISTYNASFVQGKREQSMGLIPNSEWSQLVARTNFNILSVLEKVEQIEKIENEKNGGKENPEDAMRVNTSDNQNDNRTLKNKNSEKQTIRVFISYNHNDAEIANKLKEALRNNDIEVLIDSERMNAGEDIKEFIEGCVRESDVTLSVVSRKSLMSAWVAMESVNTFYHEKTSDKRFIACFIDAGFFKRSFTDEVLDHIDTEIDDINQTIAKRLQRNRGIADLQNELKRYRDIEHNIDEIIRRLRESLCIDIIGDNFDKNLPKIISSIKEG